MSTCGLWGCGQTAGKKDVRIKITDGSKQVAVCAYHYMMLRDAKSAQEAAAGYARAFTTGDVSSPPSSGSQPALGAGTPEPQEPGAGDTA